MGLGIAPSNPPLATLLAILAAIVVTLAYVRWSVAQRLRRLYPQRRAYRDSFATRVDDAGFRTTSSRYEDRRRWPAFQRWTEDAHCLLLYEADDSRIIPKRLLGGDSRVAALRELLTAHLGPAA